jgi:hypothetical protein
MGSPLRQAVATYKFARHFLVRVIFQGWQYVRKPTAIFNEMVGATDLRSEEKWLIRITT